MNNEELIEHIYSMHLQNNTERTDFDRAFKFGIECAIEELIELKKLRVGDVSESVCPNFDACVNKGKNKYCSLETFKSIDCFIGQNEH